jgi:hypothetical protein
VTGGTREKENASRTLEEADIAEERNNEATRQVRYARPGGKGSASEWPVIRPESVLSAEITAYKPTSHY